jgi:TIR domain-containing protein
MADVFISYSQKAPEPTKVLAEALQVKGYDLWWDQRLAAGDAFDDVIQDQLEDAKAVIVIWTAASVASKYVRREVGIALAWDKLIPVRVTDLLSTEIPAPFQMLHTGEVADIQSIEDALQKKGIRPQQPGRRKSLSREELIAQLGRADQALPAAVDAWLRRCQQEGFRVVASDR